MGPGVKSQGPGLPPLTRRLPEAPAPSERSGCRLLLRLSLVPCRPRLLGPATKPRMERRSPTSYRAGNAVGRGSRKRDTTPRRRASPAPWPRRRGAPGPPPSHGTFGPPRRLRRRGRRAARTRLRRPGSRPRLSRQRAAKRRPPAGRASRTARSGPPCGAVKPRGLARNSANLQGTGPLTRARRLTNFATTRLRGWRGSLGRWDRRGRRTPGGDGR
jgi:hypothetical protein